MSVDEIRSYRNAQPFQPFNLVLEAGKKLFVAAPERIAIAPWGRLGVFVGSVPHTPRVEDVVRVELSPGTSAVAS